MSVTLGDIVTFIRADDSKADGDLRGFEGKALGWVRGLGGTLAGVLGGVVTAAIGGAVALGGAAFAAGEQLDQAFDTLLIKTGAEGDALEQLKNDFRGVFTSIPTDAQSAADVLALLHQRTTLVGDANQDLAKQLLESSRILGGDAKTNTEAYTRLIGDWSISNEEASSTLDMVFVASQKTGIGMDRLMQLAVQFGSPMRLMGFSLNDTIALLSKWEKEGVNTELVMGSLRIAAGKFADEGKPLKESLMATFDAIKNNTDATEALNLGMDVFGARAGPDMVAAIREGRFAIEDLLPLLQDSDGAIMNAAAAAEDWGEKLTKFKNKAIVALEPVGGKLLEMAGMILDKAGPAFEKFIPLIDKYAVPAVEKLATVLGLLLEGNIEGALTEIFGSEAAGQIMAFAGTVSDFVNNVIMPFVDEHSEELKGAVIGIGVALAGAGIVALISAIGAALAAISWPIVAIVALVALLGAAWAGNWGGIQEKTAAVIAFIQQVIADGMAFIQTVIATALTVIGPLFNAFQAAFAGDWYAFGQYLRQAWDAAWELITSAVSNAWANIKGALTTLTTNAINHFKNINWAEVGKNIVMGIANGIKNNITAVINSIVSVSEAIMDTINGFFEMESPSKLMRREVATNLVKGAFDWSSLIKPGLFEPALSRVPSLVSEAGNLGNFSRTDNSVSVIGNVSILANDERSLNALMREMARA